MSKLEESAFGLSQEELEQIRYAEILKRRKERNPSKRFSDKLSMEAQIAMQLALEEDPLPKEGCPDQGKEAGGCASIGSVLSNSNTDPTLAHPPGGVGEPGANPVNSTSASSTSSTEAPNKKRLSVSEAYERNNSLRMPEDITVTEESQPITAAATISSQSGGSGSRQALGGGKVHSAMEIVEYVNSEQPSSAKEDEDAIEILARINSVEKCVVWMETTDVRDPDARREVTAHQDQVMGFEQREMES